MDLGFLQSSSSALSCSPQFSPFFSGPVHLRSLSYHRAGIPRRRCHAFRFRVRSSSSPEWSDWQRLSQSIQRGSHRFWSKCGDSLKKETGFDVEEAGAKARELAGKVMERVMMYDDEITRLRTELLPAFLQWNRWERWKVILNCRKILLSC